MPSPIDMFWYGEETIHASCPMCLSTGPHRLFVRVLNSDAPLKDEKSWTCDTCGGFFAWPFEYPDYEEDYGGPNYLRYYCEIGAGIETMIAPIVEASLIKKIRRMIDVGCGVPFTVDFARHHLGIEAFGIDPSRYAREGSALLDAPVEFAILGAGSRFDGERFDLVISSEVVEHVSDPIGFLKTLAMHVADDGLLLVTTPSAGFVQPSRNVVDSLGIIWPGIHHALFSANNLERLLIDLGFADVAVREDHERLYAWARRCADPDTPLPVKQADETKRAWFDYEEGLRGRLGNGRDALIVGNLFRRLRDAVSLGKRSESEELQQALIANTRHGYGVDVGDYEAFVRECGHKDQEELFAKWPYFTYVVYYYFGMIELMKGQFNAAEKYFSAHCRLIEENRFQNAFWWGEGTQLYPLALFHKGYAQLLDGRQQEAEQIFDAIIANNFMGKSNLPSLARRDFDLQIRALTQRGVCKLQTGRALDATIDFRHALEMSRQSNHRDAFENEICGLMNVAMSLKLEMVTL